MSFDVFIAIALAINTWLAWRNKNDQAFMGWGIATYLAIKAIGERQ